MTSRGAYTSKKGSAGAKRTGKKRKGKKRPMVKRESFAFSGIMGK